MPCIAFEAISGWVQRTLLGHLILSKTKYLKRPDLEFWFKVFYSSANALCMKSVGGNINKQVSVLDCMDFSIFSSLNGFSCLISENQLIFTLLRCRKEKIWEKRSLNPKSTWTWQLEIKWWLVGNHELQSVFKQHATNLTYFFRAESSFNENISEKVSLIGLA